MELMTLRRVPICVLAFYIPHGTDRKYYKMLFSVL